MKYLSTTQAATILNISHITLYTWIKKKNHPLKPIHINGKFEYLKKEVEAYKKYLDLFISYEEAARILNVTRITLFYWIKNKNNSLKSIRINGKIKYVKKEVEAYKKYLDSFISWEEAASILNVQPGTLVIWRKNKNHSLKPIRINGVFKYRKKEVEAYKKYLDSFISCKEAARILNVNFLTIYRWIKNKNHSLKHILINGKFKYRKKEVEAYKKYLDSFISCKEAARMIGISSRKLFLYLHKKGNPLKIIGYGIRSKFIKKDVEAYIKKINGELFTT